MAIVKHPILAKITGTSDPIDSSVTLRAIQKKKCENSLANFIRYAWPIIEPGQPYIHNWHVDHISAHLTAITDGVVLEDGTPYNRLLINVPPGPMRWDSIVETARGPIQLQDVVVGDMVLTHKGRYRTIEAVHDQGILPILKITTHSGRITHAAPSHPYLTQHGWVDAKDLQISDSLAVVNRHEDRPNVVEIDPHVARLLGYMVADGSLTQASPCFINGDAEVVKDFEHCVAFVGFKTSKIRRKTHWNVRVLGGKRVREFFARYNLLGKTSYTKRIPKQIVDSGITTLQHFVGAYWTGDGSIDVKATHKLGSKYKATADTVSYGLAWDVGYTLGMLGIEAVIRTKTRKIETFAQPGGVYKYYSIQINKEEMTAKLGKLPGICSRKRDKAAPCRVDFDRPIWKDPIVSIEPSEPAHCFCLTVAEDHSFVCSGIAVKNTMKSLLVNCFWPSWEWGPRNMPHLRYVCAAHEQNLAVRDGLRMRRLIQSEWYQSFWGDRVTLTGDNNQKIKFENTATGFRQSIAAGGITGARGDRVLIDDPISVEGASSDAVRASTNEWFTEAVPLRLNNPKTSAIVVIMQRLHEEDVSGIILEKDLGYDHICLPMRYDPSRAHETQLGYSDPREEEGELLFPERFPPEVVDRDEKAMGPFATAGQHQQSPEPRGGGIIKRDWWIKWDDDVYPPLDFVCASLDTAYTEKTENDMSALTVWGVFSQDIVAQPTRTVSRAGTLYDYSMEHGRKYAEQHPKVVLTTAWAERLELHALVTKVAKTCKDMKVDLLLIEGKASGISVAQEIQRLYNRESWGVQLINPGAMDKIARLYSVQHLFSEGMIYAPDRSWADMVITQCAQFPKAKFDDLCDTVSQGLSYLRKTGMLVRSAEHLENINERMQHKPNPPPLYDV